MSRTADEAAWDRYNCKRLVELHLLSQQPVDVHTSLALDANTMYQIAWDVAQDRELVRQILALDALALGPAFHDALAELIAPSVARIVKR